MVAMARAATGAKKKAMTVTSTVPTRAGTRAFWIPMPKVKKRKVARMATSSPMPTMGRARLRSGRATAWTSRVSWCLRPSRLFLMERIIAGREASTPMMAAPAMAPTPMMRT